MKTPSIQVKICGLTNVEDARFALDSGADYLGFVLYPKSPRAVTGQVLARIVDRLPAACRAVGVFVNESRETVSSIAGDCGLAAVQIHGDENADGFSDMAVTVWREIHFAGGAPCPNPAAWPAERYVVDAAPEGQYGGSGREADRDAAREFAARYPTMLAGGLTPESVAAAIRAVNPLGVDVSSGVEAEPGRKDPEKVRRFLAEARGHAGEAA